MGIYEQDESNEHPALENVRQMSSLRGSLALEIKGCYIFALLI